MWPTQSYYYLTHLKCAKLPRLSRCILLVLVVLLTLVVVVELTIGRAATWYSEGVAARDGRRQLQKEVRKASTKNSSLLYECELSYLQMDLSLIKFSINYLERRIEPAKLTSRTRSQVAADSEQQVQQDENKIQDDNQAELDGFRLARIDYNSSIDELLANTKLNTKLPFVFFINGFNTFAPYDEINATWMYDVARSFARRQSDQDLSYRLEEPEPNDQCSLLTRIHRFLARAARGSFRGSEDNVDENEDDKKSDVPFAAGRNVVFLTWSIPDLFASNLFSMIPAYYKTVANYDLIVDYVAGTIVKFIKLIEQNNQFKSANERSRYYSQFQFYGHSLGSHIFSDAISRVVSELAMRAEEQERQERVVQIDVQAPYMPAQSQLAQFNWTRTKSIKFGKLMGLDPASPCFVSLEYGISSSKVSEAVDEVVVLHSNAGFAGIPNERANLEIVLNGGTFQPGCVWYDFTCSHVRSTDILSYIDDECQMVAYKCTSYNHFKQGACEACLDSDSSLFKGMDGNINNVKERNCVLVNLPEQHRDKPQVLAYADQMSNRTRQLAEAASKRAANVGSKFEQQPPFKQIGPIRRSSDTKNATIAGDAPPEAKNKKSYFHYVNTSANFRFGRKSHCLQHYQLRLLIYNEDLRLREKCKLSSFYVKSSDEIKLKLFYEDYDQNLEPNRSLASRSKNLASRFLDRRAKVQPPAKQSSNPLAGRRLVSKMFRDSDDPRIMSNQIKLGAIVKDVFHTALVNFESGPKLFVGAQLDNLDLGALAECYKRENATSGPKFVLDIAFMSHTNQKVRYAYSSVLCGQLKLSIRQRKERIVTNNNDNKDLPSFDANVNARQTQTIDRGDDLMLNLCKQSELKNVSAEIDKLLDQIKLHLLDETWKVSLLNSLFSLFTEWEPF